MIPIQKNKRNHSGSRSKCKKIKGNQYSVDLRAKNNQNEMIKTKTQNSSSLNKSKPSRKTSTKLQKKHTYIVCQTVNQIIDNQNKIKEPVSHSVSAERKHSLINKNHTQPFLEGQDLQNIVDNIILGMKGISQPSSLNSKLLGQYFKQIERYYNGLQRPFKKLCEQLHEYYLRPINRFLILMAPMQDALKRKQQITVQIDKQIAKNQQMYQQLQPIDIQIFKLREKIEQNRILLQQKRYQKKLNQSLNQRQQNMNNQINETSKNSLVPNIQIKNQGNIKGFKLDLQDLKKSQHMSYHDQFYSKLDQFSESWRDQALRQKRF